MTLCVPCLFIFLREFELPPNLCSFLCWFPQFRSKNTFFSVNGRVTQPDRNHNDTHFIQTMVRKVYITTYLVLDGTCPMPYTRSVGKRDSEGAVGLWLGGNVPKGSALRQSVPLRPCWLSLPCWSSKHVSYPFVLDLGRRALRMWRNRIVGFIAQCSIEDEQRDCPLCAITKHMKP